jgi:thioredoxin reductase
MKTEYPVRIESKPYDVAIIGAGMAGISAAFAARRRGATVVIFEPEAVGGT